MSEDKNYLQQLCDFMMIILFVLLIVVYAQSKNMISTSDKNMLIAAIAFLVLRFLLGEKYWMMLVSPVLLLIVAIMTTIVYNDMKSNPMVSQSNVQMMIVNVSFLWFIILCSVINIAGFVYASSHPYQTYF